MSRVRFLFCLWLGLTFAALHGQTAAPAEPAASTAATNAGADRATQAVAATAAQQNAPARTPDFLEHLVDSILSAFDVRTGENTVTHYAIAAALLVMALLARRIVTGILFVIFRRVASRTSTTLDDKLSHALEAPFAGFVVLIGIFSALKVLKLSNTADIYIGHGSRVAFSLTVFWILWRALHALLEHGEEIARARGLSVTAFMPWIRKSLLTLLVVLAVLLTIQSLGYDVRAILAGLGIGGLAFALAAQDTLANIFGAVVVAVDQPFRVGEFVQIGGNAGLVEDIGLRSTRLRRADKSLLVIPNKTVAAEVVVNLARFTRRRIEQVIPLTYDTPPEQMDAIVAEIRTLIQSQPEVDPNSVIVYFRDLSASSLDLWIVYETTDADFHKSMRVRQRLNLAFMNAVKARGLAFARPTQTVRFEGELAERMVAAKDEPPDDRQG